MRNGQAYQQITEKFSVSEQKKFGKIDSWTKEMERKQTAFWKEFSTSRNFLKVFFRLPTFLSFLSNWTKIGLQESILVWLQHHFHLVYWMRRDSNSQPFDKFAIHSNSLTPSPSRNFKRQGQICRMNYDSVLQMKFISDVYWCQYDFMHFDLGIMYQSNLDLDRPN